MTTTLEMSDAAGQKTAAGWPVRLATVFGLGYSPVAPGTAGSLAAVALFTPFLFVLPSAGGLAPPLAGLASYVVALGVLAAAGWWSTEKALPHWGGHDPQAIVIDEVVGQWLSYGGLVAATATETYEPGGAGWKYLLAGFILFRVFDVTKPFPIRRVERWRGATGVLADDILAGVFAAVILWVVTAKGWLQ